MQEFPHIFFIDEASAVGLEKLVQVESIFRGRGLVVKADALPYLVAHDVAHPVGEKVQARHVFIGITVQAVPVLLGLLFLGIAPVEDLVVGKLPSGNGLERGAREVEGEPSPYVVEGAVGALRVNALVGLVDDQQVPFQLPHPLQFVIGAAEEYGPFQPLQAFKTYLPVEAVARARRAEPFHELLARHHVALVAQGVVVAHKAEARLPPYEALEVVVPRVGNARAIGHNEHVERLFALHAPYQFIGGERLAEAGLGVPKEFAARPPAHVVQGEPDGLLLLVAKHIRGADGHAGILPGGKLVEIHQRPGAVYVEPFGAGMALHVFAPFQEVVEVVVAKEFSAAVLKKSVVLPQQFILYPSGVYLLADAPLHAVLGFANLCPSLVLGIPGRLIGVNHRHHAPEAADMGFVVHHAISFTLVRMKLRSWSSRPYLSNSCSSISAMDLLQSMSEDEVKS